ncbi:rod shape-determining protein MreD [Siminovitchia sp. 179-K 8D1 HS]|uniref:rod shape-determining protein MreD n=1 Tax=Siminovitchia sp. 179-K 8D1 HS TaxID=3142385 RepID=UPI0039A1DFB9
MKRILLPLALFACFYGESLFVDLFSTASLFKDRLVIPHFLLIALTLMGIYFFRNTAIMYAAAFGLIFDIYYTEIIGVYLFLFPISVYIASKMIKLLQVNVLTAALIVIINISLVEWLIYGLNILLFNVPVRMMEFLENRLLPSLALNLIFYFIIFVPYTRWLQHLHKKLSSE